MRSGPFTAPTTFSFQRTSAYSTFNRHSVPRMLFVSLRSSLERDNEVQAFLEMVNYWMFKYNPPLGCCSFHHYTITTLHHFNIFNHISKYRWKGCCKQRIFHPHTLLISHCSWTNQRFATVSPLHINSHERRSMGSKCKSRCGVNNSQFSSTPSNGLNNTFVSASATEGIGAAVGVVQTSKLYNIRLWSAPLRHISKVEQKKTCRSTSRSQEDKEDIEEREGVLCTRSFFRAKPVPRDKEAPTTSTPSSAFLNQVPIVQFL